MDLLDQIAVYRGCEPSVIISYVAVVREVYLHACTNLKKEDVNTQERKRQLLEQWRQIEKHFAKIKYAMLDCWPVGNEPDLMAAYVSIALLYSLYKDVSDEKIIRQCHEAAERARKCGRVNLSESQFNEVQQYCDMIENIFFLRRQSAVSVSISKKRHVNSNVISDDDDQLGSNNDTESDSQLHFNIQQQLTSAPAASNFLKCNPDKHSSVRYIKDGPTILTEYGKLTTAGKGLTSENKCQKRLRPSDLEIKTAQKKLKYQKLINSTTVLTEFESVLLKRNATGNGDFEFPRPSDLKSANTRHYGPKCNLHLPDLYPANADNFNSLKANAKDFNLSNRIYQVLESSPIPNESPSSANQKISKMASAVVSITSKDKTISESSQATDPNYSSCAQESQTNTVFQKLECYANEFVEKIIHSIIKMNEKPRICSRRNLEKIQVMDTPTVLTSNNCPISKQEFIVKLNNGSGTIDAKPDRMNKNILIRARKILRANIDQQIEDVFMESVAKTTPMGVITDPNSDDRLGKQIYEGGGMSNKTIVVEDHAEMQLSHNYIPGSLCNLQQTFESIASSDLSLITAPRAKLTTSVAVKPITIIGFSNLIDSSNKLTRDKKKLETESAADALEELKKKEIRKLFAGKLKIETYMVPGHSIKFGNFWEELQELKGNKQQQLSTATKTILMVTAAKIVLKQTMNQAGPDYVMQKLDDTKRKFTVTQSKFLASKGNVFSGTDKNVSSVIWASNETISSATKINQKLQTAMTNHFDSSLDNTPMQKSNTDEICLTEIILDETRNFTKVSENSHTNRIKSQNEPLSKEILFEKYANFEPPLCKLQRVPEFDAMPLFREHLQSNSRVPFQKFLIESMIPDQIRHQEYISDSKKEIQGVSKEVDNCEAILNFPVMVYSAFRKTKLRTVESIDVSTTQIKRIAKPDFQQPGQAFEIPSISSSSQITRINSENTTPSITNQEPVITEFEINEYIGSEQKIEKKCDGVKSELILKEIVEKKEFSFTRNINQYHEKKEIQLDTFVIAPEIQQISLHRPQIAPPCPPLRQKLNKPTSIFSKPLLPRGYKHLVVAEKPFEAKKGFTKCDSKNTSFVASANSCQELLGVSEERASEDEKCQTLVYCEEKHSTIYDLENKLLTIRKESSEQLHENQETSAPLEVIQMPHFDAKAEFDKRLSVKKSHCGEVPVIVKNATLKSDSKLRLLKCLTNNSLIPPTLRLNVNEKPDFNFMIKNK
ncbi:hypothetical protein QQG55_3615 [Brugia pahangi]